MIQKKKKSAGSQAVGENLAFSWKEQEEDLLETLYQWYREDRPLALSQIYGNFGLTKKEIRTLMCRMEKDGYLTVQEPSGKLILTDFGKAQGAECLSRHQNLTQFLEMVCGVDEETAQVNACRMEHVLSQEIVQGFERFIRYGDMFERSVKNSNLQFLYEQGEYQFCMSIYRAGIRYPRILAEEYVLFDSMLRLEVGEEKSSFWIKERRGEKMKILWYRDHGGWVRAGYRKGEYRIPTEIFVFSFVPGDPIIEGECVIALTGEDRETPEEKDFRELNVHMWQEGTNGAG